MPANRVTVAVVPRERFSKARQCLEALYEHTAGSFRLVYVSAGAPAAFNRYVRKEAERRGFELVLLDHFVAGNRARNLALRLVNTEYVVFLDNDALVTPGWLDPLVRCADETGAWLVAPVYCEATLDTIHMAGGDARIEIIGGKRRFYEKHHLHHVSLADARAGLGRRRCELVEYHCLLARRAALAPLLPLDEGFLSSREHIDLCLGVQAAGGSIYVEPESAVAYLEPPPLAWADLPYFALRWSDAWNRTSMEHFRDKWNLDPADPAVRRHYEWLTHRRRRALKPLRTALHAVLGWRQGMKAEALVDEFLARRVPGAARQRDLAGDGSGGLRPPGSAAARGDMG